MSALTETNLETLQSLFACLTATQQGELIGRAKAMFESSAQSRRIKITMSKNGGVKLNGKKP